MFARKPVWRTTKLDKMTNENTPLVFWVFCMALLSGFLGSLFLMGGHQTALSATPPTIIVYQGKLLQNDLAVTTTKAMGFAIYDSLTGGNILYTASGTLSASTTVNITPSNGIFSIELGRTTGATSTNAITKTIFQNNQNLYLEVIVVDSGVTTTLSARKQLTTVPYAFNSEYLAGVAATSTASSSTYIPISGTDGSFAFNTTTFYGGKINTIDLGSYIGFQLGSQADSSSGALTLHGSSGLLGFYPTDSLNTSVMAISLDGTDAKIDMGGQSGYSGLLSIKDSGNVQRFYFSGTTTNASYVNTNLYIGSQGTEDLANASFVLNGEDFYVHGDTGINGALYLDGLLDSANTGTSTFAGGIRSTALSITSTSATSTFANGIRLDGGCILYGGTCLTSSAGGSDGQIQYNNGGSFGGATALTYNDSNNFVGINSSTPQARLSVEDTSEQFRIGYNSGNYVSFTLNSNGDLLIDPTGADLTLDADLLANANNTFDLGAFDNAWKNAYVSSTAFVDILKVGTTTPWDNNVYNLGAFGSAFKNIFVSTTAYANALTVGAITPWQNNTYNIGAYGSAFGSVFASGTIFGNALTIDSTSVSSTFAAGIQTTALNVISTSATSTFANGIRLTGGCLYYGGTCLVPGAATAAGSDGQIQYNNGGTTLGGASLLTYDDNNNYFGINSTSPNYALSVDGLSYFNATSTFANFLNVPGKVLISSSTFIGQIDPGGNFEEIDVSGHYLYVVDYGGTLYIYNISNPKKPVQLGSIGSLGSLLEGLDVVGDFVFIANATGAEAKQIIIIDASDKTNPVLVGKFTDGTDINDIKVVGNYAYILKDSSLEVFDITSPYDPRKIGVLTISGGGGALHTLDIAGNYLFATKLNAGLVVVDISDPARPRQLTTTDIDGGGTNLGQGLAVSGNFVYFGNAADGLRVVDISNPAAPVSVGNVAPGGTLKGDVVVAGKYVYAGSASPSGFYVFDVSSSTNPVLAKTVKLEDEVRDIRVVGNYVYVANFGNGLSIFDMSGASISNAEIGSLRVDNLQIMRDALFDQTVDIRGGLMVGNSGLLVSGDIGLFAPTSTEILTATNTLRFSHTALFKSNATTTDNNVFIFDTVNSLSSANLLSIRHAGTEKLVINQNGWLGVATSTPWGMLSVEMDATNPAFVVANNGSSTPALYVGNTVQNGSVGIGVGATPYRFAVDWNGDGTNYAYVNDSNAWTAGSADYAEFFYTLDTGLSAGEAVCVNLEKANTVKRCDRPADGNLMGIISTKPAFLGNAPAEEQREKDPNYVMVGMLGQVPGKVTNENGEIRPGDSLTSATTAGLLMKANAGDPTVGVALEKLEGENGVINILISRRNQSITVAEVEEQITARIAEMEIEDEVNLMVSSAIDSLDLDDEISGIVGEQLKVIAAKLDLKTAEINERVDLSFEEIERLDGVVVSLFGDLDNQAGQIIELTVGHKNLADKFGMFSSAINIDNEFASTSLAFMSVDAWGNVGIGVDAPEHKLHVGGDVGADSFVVRLDASSTEILPPEVLADIEYGVDLFRMSSYLLGNAKEQSALLTKVQETIQSLSVAGTLQGSIQNALEVDSLTVRRHVDFGSDTAGQVKILAGDTLVHVPFTNIYEYQPLITATPVGLVTSTVFGVDKITVRGFDIVLSQAVDFDVVVSWHAFVSSQAKLLVSDGRVENIRIVFDLEEENEEVEIVVLDAPEVIEELSVSTPAQNVAGDKIIEVDSEEIVEQQAEPQNIENEGLDNAVSEDKSSSDNINFDVESDPATVENTISPEGTSDADNSPEVEVVSPAPAPATDTVTAEPVAQE